MILRRNIARIALDMLTDADGALDQVIQILWDFLVDTIGTKDTGDAGTSVVIYKTDAVFISEDNTNPRGHHAFLCELDHGCHNLLRRDLLPVSRPLNVWECATAFTFSFTVLPCHKRSGVNRFMQQAKQVNMVLTAALTPELR